LEGQDPPPTDLLFERLPAEDVAREEQDMSTETNKELDAAMRQADSHQLNMIIQYGKPNAARAARREVARRKRQAKL
jgi:hypothetical protein